MTPAACSAARNSPRPQPRSTTSVAPAKIGRYSRELARHALVGAAKLILEADVLVVVRRSGADAAGGSGGAAAVAAAAAGRRLAEPALQHRRRALQDGELRAQLGQRGQQRPLLLDEPAVVADDSLLLVEPQRRLRRDLAILGFDERGDLLEQRDQRRLELLECGGSLAVARDQRIDGVGGARVERVLPIDPGRQPALRRRARLRPRQPAGTGGGVASATQPRRHPGGARSSAASNAVSASL